MTVQEIKAESSELDALAKELRLLLAKRAEVAALKRKLLIGDNEPTRIARIVTERIARIFDVPMEQLTDACREQRYVVPRHIALYLIRKHTMLTQTAIGEIFGRDHSTVRNAVVSIEERCATNPKFKEQLSKIESDCVAALKEAA